MNDKAAEAVSDAAPDERARAPERAPSRETERPLCRISHLPVEWCNGCVQGWHAAAKASQGRNPP